MYSAEAEAFRFRDQYWTEMGSRRVDFGSLQEILHERPPVDEMPGAKISWVAGNLGKIGDGLQSVGLPHDFNFMYQRVSERIAANVDTYTYNAALGRATIEFEGDFYRRPLSRSLDFLEGNDAALHRISDTWIMTLLSSILLRSDTPQWFQTGMGMTSHMVSRDLQGAVFATRPPQGYGEEYTKFVGRDINAVIDEQERLIPGTRATRRVTAAALKRLVAAARAHAWQKYEEAKLIEASELNADDSATAEDNESPSDRLEAHWQAADERAARLNRMYLAVGGPVVAMARLADRRGFGKLSKAEDDRAA